MNSRSERRSYNIVGKSVPRIDGPAKVTGRAKYAGDIVLPRMLCGKILRSTHPHARILSIDASSARRVVGVKAIVTGADIPKVKYGIAPFSADRYALAVDKVRYIGDPIAAVAAVDEDAAEEALRLIRVEYEPLPAVFDPEEAKSPGAPLIHEEAPNNVSASIVKEWGDVASAFKRAYHVREDTFRTQCTAHAPLEPHVAVANYEPNGRLTLWSSTQIPFYLRRNLSKTLGLDEGAIRVIKPFVGGGFGGKVDMYAHDFAAAFLSMKTGRPVRISLERWESMTCTTSRHPMTIRLKTAVDEDGTILAQDYHLIADGGAYNSTAPILISLSAFFVMLPYRVPNLRFRGEHVYTNKPVNGPKRGHGVPQVRFACECQLEAIADDLGIDPVELRLRNAVRVGEEHPGGLTIRSCGFSECIRRAADAIGWKEKRARANSGELRGVGMGCSAFPCGVNTLSHVGSAATVKIERDGSVTLLTGASDIGQGSDTVLAQIAAEELGVRYEDIHITSGDTELTPHDIGTFGSGVTFRAGNAVRLAAQDAKNQIFEVVAPILGTTSDDLVSCDGTISSRSDPSRKMTFREALRACQYADRPVPVVGRGYFQPPAKEPATLMKEPGDFSGAYSFGVQTAEVAIDRDTGRVRVIRTVTAHDAGFSINPQAVEVQLQASTVGGLGEVLYEELINENGLVLNATLTDYNVPTVFEAPEMGAIDVETNDPIGPFGAKEAGEGILVFTVPAVANAISNALGTRITELPITPEKILKIVRAKEIP